MEELKLVLQHLKQPEYVHVLLNPIPVYGTAMGIVALVVGWISRQKQAQLAGLVVLFLASISAWPVVHYGQQSYDRVYAMSNQDAQKWLDVHMERAERWEYLFYATAGLAAASMAALWKYPKASIPLSAVTLALAVACAVVGAWIGHAGGQVRHSEFRDGPPPSPAIHKDDHH